MYLGAVVGSSGLMSSDATASLISRDIVPDAESFNPNRSLIDHIHIPILGHPAAFLGKHGAVEQKPI